MNAKTLVCTTAAALAMTAGLAAALNQPANTQPGTQPGSQQPYTQPATSPAQPADSSRQAGAHSYEFVKFGDVTGMDVVGPEGDKIGEIKDLIIARGSGRIEYALIEGGGVVGVGGKTIALPYHALRYDTAEKQLVTDLTQEQFEAAAEFTPENWTDLEHTTWTQELENWWDTTILGEPEAMDDADDDFERREAERARAAAGSATAINGTITRVLREEHHGEEVICIEVQPTAAINEVDKSHIILGPSWFVMGNNAPMRGDQVNLRAYPAEGSPDDPDDMDRTEGGKWVALSGTIDGRQVSFRSDQGAAGWNEDQDAVAGEARRAGRLMLASALVGADARASDEDGGEIQNVIIECKAGQIAFIGFDPNENVLGWGDNIILVPWTLVSVNANHEARIDATRAMLLASEEVPDDLDVLTQAPRPGSLYASYNVEPPEFTTRESEHRHDFARSPWDADGEITTAFAHGPSASFTGRIKEVKTETILPGAPEATVLIIGTETGDRRVVIGPKDFTTRQGMRFSTDQAVSVRGTTAMLNGIEYIAARSIMVDGRTVEVWTEDEPLWDDN